MTQFFFRVLAWLGVCLGAAGALKAAPKETFPGVDGKWQRYQSPHFELFSRNSDERSRRLLRNLEMLHAVFLGTFHFAERRPIEVAVYYFQNDRELTPYKYAQYGKDREIAAYYQEGPDRSVVALSAEYGFELTQQIVFHEYIHHLFRVAEEKPPLWYNEGMAELFATIEVGAEHLTFGKPLMEHVYTLQQERLLPLATLFAVDHQSSIYAQGQHTGLFYAESWTLLHYFYFGQTNLPRERLDPFLRYVVWKGENISAAELEAAFRQVLGMGYADMEKLLERYVHSGRYGSGTLPLPKIPPPEGYACRAVPREEIRDRLAELALRVNRDPRGKLAMLQALERNPADVRALETLGALGQMEGDETVLRERWEQAIAAGSTNPTVYHELALFEGRRWFGHFDYYFRLPEQKAEDLRKLLLRSIECAPDQVAAYELLAWVEASAPEPKPAHVNLVQKHFASLKEKHRTLLALALVRARVGDKEAAMRLLADLEKMEPEPVLRQQAKYVQRRLQGRPDDEDTPSEAEEPTTPAVMPLLKPPGSNG